MLTSIKLFDTLSDLAVMLVAQKIEFYSFDVEIIQFHRSKMRRLNRVWSAEELKFDQGGPLCRDFDLMLKSQFFFRDFSFFFLFVRSRKCKLLEIVERIFLLGEKGREMGDGASGDRGMRDGGNRGMGCNRQTTSLRWNCSAMWQRSVARKSYFCQGRLFSECDVSSIRKLNFITFR